MLGFQAAYARRGIKLELGEWLALGYQFRISLRPRSWHWATTALGHEARFPTPRLSPGFGFRKETIAGIRRHGRGAPTPDLRARALERVGSTQPV